MRKLLLIIGALVSTGWAANTHAQNAADPYAQQQQQPTGQVYQPQQQGGTAQQPTYAPQGQQQQQYYAAPTQQAPSNTYANPYATSDQYQDNDGTYYGQGYTGQDVNDLYFSEY